MQEVHLKYNSIILELKINAKKNADCLKTILDETLLFMAYPMKPVIVDDPNIQCVISKTEQVEIINKDIISGARDKYKSCICEQMENALSYDKYIISIYP